MGRHEKKDPEHGEPHEVSITHYSSPSGLSYGLKAPDVVRLNYRAGAPLIQAKIRWTLASKSNVLKLLAAAWEERRTDANGRICPVLREVRV
jgi:hypothetical protein